MIDLFWWAPARMPRIALEEMTQRRSAWVHQFMRSGRLLSNFGDELSPLIVEEVFRERVRWRLPEHATLLALGSILDLYLAVGGRGAAVWGSGLRNPGAVGSESTERFGRILAVRGPVTSAALNVDCALGDPGVLVPLVCGAQVPANRRRGIAVVGHFSDFGRPQARSTFRAIESRGAQIVAPNTPAQKVIAAIAKSELVLSSSLHGLICAHALGIPAAVLTFESSTEPPAKYGDFYRALGVEPDLATSAGASNSSLSELIEGRVNDERLLEDLCREMAASLVSAVRGVE